MEENEETWTEHCHLCDMDSHFSTSNPYGTCMCS